MKMPSGYVFKIKEGDLIMVQGLSVRGWMLITIFTGWVGFAPGLIASCWGGGAIDLAKIASTDVSECDAEELIALEVEIFRRLEKVGESFAELNAAHVNAVNGEPGLKQELEDHFTMYIGSWSSAGALLQSKLNAIQLERLLRR